MLDNSVQLHVASVAAVKRRSFLLLNLQLLLLLSGLLPLRLLVPQVDRAEREGEHGGGGEESDESKQSSGEGAYGVSRLYSQTTAFFPVMSPKAEAKWMACKALPLKPLVTQTIPFADTGDGIVFMVMPPHSQINLYYKLSTRMRCEFLHLWVA